MVFKKDTITSRFNTVVSVDQWGQIKPSQTTWIIIAIIGVTALALQFQGNSKPAEIPDEPIVEMDTYIPEGMSLVPIRIANYESLDQIIGQFGVVDLLTTPLSPDEKAKRVAYAVKLVRAPRNPRHFSVLVPSEKAHKLVGHTGEYTVSVRNPKLLGTKFVKEKRKFRKARISYDMESQ